MVSATELQMRRGGPETTAGMKRLDQECRLCAARVRNSDERFRGL